MTPALYKVKKRLEEDECELERLQEEIESTNDPRFLIPLISVYNRLSVRVRNGRLKAENLKQNKPANGHPDLHDHSFSINRVITN